MKVIFSRKGFDSSAGGSPSLIFPDGTLFSIPIPSTDENYYSELAFQYEGDSIQKILNDLIGSHSISGKKKEVCDFSLRQQSCHYDPMPIANVSKFVLGQGGSAAAHLLNQHVGVGDIFLFYGWFKQVEKQDGIWKYSYESKDIHLIWSWMKVGELLDIGTANQREQVLAKRPYLKTHPHLMDYRDSPRDPPNWIYISEVGGMLPYSENRRLTDFRPYVGRSTWRLPNCFNQPLAFSFLKNFFPDGDEVIVKYRGYGQEFVLNLDLIQSLTAREEIMIYLSANIFNVQTFN